MRHLWKSAGLLLTLSISCSAQSSTNDNNINPDLNILGCDALECARNNNKSICHSFPNQQDEEHEAYGVAMLPNALKISENTSLSLTLIDGYPVSRSINSITGDTQNTRSLYFGAPQNAVSSLKNRNPGCALMMQHDGATFPYASSDRVFDMKSTTCPIEFLSQGSTNNLISSWVRDFNSRDLKFNTTSHDHCEALAQYMGYRAHTDSTTNTIGGYYSALTTFAGGAVSGPDVDTDNVAEITTSLDGSTNPETCQPVQPQNYNLYNVTSMSQILRSNAMDQNHTFGGRTGYTPIVSVLYGNDENADPEVQFYCVHVRASSGEELPYSDFVTSGASDVGRWEVIWLVAFAMVVTAWIA